MNPDYLYGILGGILIGLAAAGMLLSIGRVMGVSGIIGGILVPQHREVSWRLMFLFGILGGVFVAQALGFSIMEIEIDRSLFAYGLGGLLVGVGTTLGSGCTSGHGVCGISRLSPRSIIATLAYIFAGIITVYIINHVIGGF